MMVMMMMMMMMMKTGIYVTLDSCARRRGRGVGSFIREGIFRELLKVESWYKSEILLRRMVADTGSARKASEEVDGSSQKKKKTSRTDVSEHSPEKAGVSALRRSSRETPASKQSTTSPQSIGSLPKQATPNSQTKRKSHRVVGSPSLPPINKDSHRQDKNDVPTPLRRSDREKNNNSSSSSLGSKKLEQDLCPSELTRKRKRALIQATLESEEAERDPKPGTTKKKKMMNGHVYKALFKGQQIHNIESNGDMELDVPEKSSTTCIDNSKGVGSEPMGSGKDPIDFPERLSSIENMSAPESESSTCVARSRDGSVSSESHEECVHPRGISSLPSPSRKCDYQNLLGTCILCSKSRRVGYDSAEQELCSCSIIRNEDAGNFSSKARSNLGAGDQGKVCGFCCRDGELLYCGGKSCKTCYHLCCLDRSLANAVPVVWYCSQCVNKKFLFGPPSVSKGMESIWDVRDVDISNTTGVRQKQYLVKYHGLGHIHNHWVPEQQVLVENPGLISNFIERNKTVRWGKDWTVPHCLLRRRCIEDSIFVASPSVISVCNYELLVKWRGLSCDEATWELESAPFLGSSLGETLMERYEIRRSRAHQGANKEHKRSIVELSELPTVLSHGNDNMLKNVNKLRKCLSKCQNAVVFDDQERVMAILLLIQSMSQICWPFLIVTTSSSLSHWEAEAEELMPSVDVVVYNGSRTARTATKTLEFYDEDEHLTLQVLLTSAEAFLEDLDVFKSIRWDTVVIDEHEQSWASDDLEKIKELSADSRILLSTGKRKDTSDYLRILSLLESQGDFEKVRGLKNETNDNISKLRDRLSNFIAYGSTAQVSKFLEFWVPVEISKFQMEQYCANLLLNSTLLQSCSRNDSVGALRDVLLTVRKCCDHPYLLDPSSQERLIADKRPPSDLLDIGIKASGKLQFLDMMLTEIKAQGLQVLILFQLITGSGGASTGDILDDFLRQRFGQNTYERVDAITTVKKRQASVNRFNNKETGQFAILVENRACTQLLKFSSLDAIIIYASDWNPANDLKALQRISVDSKVGQIKVFRLYSCFTVEEGALVRAKKNLQLENNLERINRTTSNSLLSWGAINLFRKLDEYHADRNSTSDLTSSSDQVLLNEVAREFRVLFSENFDDTDSYSIISKAKLGVQSYTTDAPVFGELQVNLKEGEEPHVFWRNLLHDRIPRWKHLSGTGAQNRKRIHQSIGSVSRSETKKADVVKKHKVLADVLDETLTVAEGELKKAPQVSIPKEIEGTQKLQEDNITPTNDQNCMSGQRLFGPEASRGKQEDFFNTLQLKLRRLCQNLLLSNDVNDTAKRFLEYVIQNHHVSTDSPSIMQAFELSLCWIAASIRKRKVDKKASLMLAQQLLKYQCTEEQVSSVYSKMRQLKRMYLQSSDNAEDNTNGQVHGLLGEDNTSGEPSSVNQESPQIVQHKEVLKKCTKLIKKLTQRHQKEIEKFQQIWQEKRSKLETDHKLESALIRSIHQDKVSRMSKLKLLEDNFAKKLEEHNLRKNVKLKELEEKQFAILFEEKRKVDEVKAKVEECARKYRAVNGQESLSSHSEADAGGLQPSAGMGEASPIVGNVAPLTITTETALAEAQSNEALVENMSSGNLQTDAGEISPKLDMTELLNQPKDSHCIDETVVGNLAPTLPITSETAPAEARSNESPVENMSSCNLQNDVAELLPSLDMAKLLNQPKHLHCIDETVLGDVSAPGVLDSGEGELVDANEGAGVASETGPNGNIGNICTLESSSASKKQSSKGNEIADTLVSQRDESYVAATAGNLEQTSDTAVTRLSSDKSPITENSTELHIPSADPAPGCNVSEDDRGRSSSPTAELCRTQTLPYESIPGDGQSSGTHGIGGDIAPNPDDGHGQAIESELPQSNVATAPVGVSSAEPTNRVVQPVTVAGQRFGSVPHPTQQPAHWNPAQVLHPDPLQTELEIMFRENELVEKNQASLLSQLNHDCEKEVQELIAQIRLKYDLKIQEAEAEYKSKRNEMERRKNILYTQKILAEAVRSKCWETRSSGLPSIQQGAPSMLTQHPPQVQSPPSVRPFPVPSPSHPAPVQRINTQPQRPVHPTPPSAQQINAPQQRPRHPSPTPSHQISTPPQPRPRHPSPTPSQLRPGQGQNAAPSRQPVQAPPPSTRPLVINTISSLRNTRVSGEIRSPAPHLQAFRSRPPIPVSSSPVALQSYPLQPLQLPLLPSMGGSQDRPPELQTAPTLSQSMPTSETNHSAPASDVQKKQEPARPPGFASLSDEE
ncbi:helicase protein MOM1-like isoform X2 [Andrographis paniculata]|uniref:helicase protein MOM1-like isoform X2 n=1 Tax=Andrographis paniculata TaxID=175694 RepID=UPI0021E9858F|nr:helicase protein MOM1-like isoform X2 [Andrographis paniculata]